MHKMKKITVPYTHLYLADVVFELLVYATFQLFSTRIRSWQIYIIFRPMVSRELNRKCTML